MCNKINHSSNQLVNQSAIKSVMVHDTCRDLAKSNKEAISKITNKNMQGMEEPRVNAGEQKLLQILEKFC